MTADLFELEAPQDALGTTEAGPAHMQPPAPVSQLTKRLEILQGGYRPNIIGVDIASGQDSTVVFQPPFAQELKGGAL